MPIIIIPLRTYQLLFMGILFIILISLSPFIFNISFAQFAIPFFYTPPSIILHIDDNVAYRSNSNILLNATGSNEADVRFYASGTAAYELYNPVTVNCNQKFGGITVPLYTNTIAKLRNNTEIACYGEDIVGNGIELNNITISIIDTTPPTIFQHPNISVNSPISPGTFLDYNVLSEDITSPKSIRMSCIPPPGTFVKIGQHKVECSATDAANNPARTNMSFLVNVHNSAGNIIKMYNQARFDTDKSLNEINKRVSDINNNQSIILLNSNQWLSSINEHLKNLSVTMKGLGGQSNANNTSVPNNATFLFIDTPFDLDTIGQILTVFAIADSLLTLGITYTMQRLALARWRGHMWIILILIWAALILPIIELQLAKPPWEFVISNLLTKIAVLIWITGVALLLFIARKIFLLDLIKYEKDSQQKPFESEKRKKWGVQSINKVLEGCENDDIYFPIVIAADEYSRPWEILSAFILSGLTSGYGGILFSFTRPASRNWSALDKMFEDYLNHGGRYPYLEFDNSKIDWEKLVIIDCYSNLAKRDKAERREIKDIPKKSRMGVPKILFADPSNPHDVNKKYEMARKYFFSDRLIALREGGLHVSGLRVGYDAISDFLSLTDFQLGTQYVRHNMGSEDERKIESLYLFRTGTLPQAQTEQYFFWFSNGLLRLERVLPEANVVSHLQADFRGPFKKGARRFKLDFQFKLINEKTSNLTEL